MRISTFRPSDRTQPIPEGTIVGTTKAGRTTHKLYTVHIATVANLQSAMSYCGYRPHGINSNGAWRSFSVADAHDYVTCERCLNSKHAPGFESIANERALNENARLDNA